jgi:hypothetical protein
MLAKGFQLPLNRPKVSDKPRLLQLCMQLRRSSLALARYAFHQFKTDVQRFEVLGLARHACCYAQMCDNALLACKAGSRTSHSKKLQKLGVGTTQDVA